MTTEHIARSIEIARQYLADHPDEARYADSAATATVESGLRCRVAGPNGETVYTDMVAGVGGGATAPSPGWLSRAAHAACDATLVAMRAAELGLDLQRVEVTVDSDSDDRGLLGVDDAVPPGPLRTRVVVRIAAPGTDEATLRDVVAWAQAHSPLGDALHRSIPGTLEITTTQGVR